eukprot:scaffold42128_cov26-Tisochrysis_lutea.AAC.1
MRVHLELAAAVLHSTFRRLVERETGVLQQHAHHFDEIRRHGRQSKRATDEGKERWREGGREAKEGESERALGERELLFRRIFFLMWHERLRLLLAALVS